MAHRQLNFDTSISINGHPVLISTEFGERILYKRPRSNKRRIFNKWLKKCGVFEPRMYQCGKVYYIHPALIGELCNSQ